MQIDPVGLTGYMQAVARNDALTSTSASVPTSLQANPFADLVSSMVNTARETGEGAEAEMAKVAAGQGDLVRTAAAVNAAEVAIETLVAVRDRMVSAYTDVLRMQI